MKKILIYTVGIITILVTAPVWMTIAYYKLGASAYKAIEDGFNGE